MKMIIRYSFTTVKYIGDIDIMLIMEQTLKML